MIENEAEKFESTQEPSTADCQRISPRKFQKAEEQVHGAVPRVASPGKERVRRVSREFKDTMVHRRSLTDNKDSIYEGTPTKPDTVHELGDDCDAAPSSTDKKDSIYEGIPTLPEPITPEQIEGTAVEAPDVVDQLGDDHSPEMVIPEDPRCKVYVGNLSYRTRFKALKDHMAQSGGVIAFAGIIGEDGSVDGYGWSRGFGFVIYETPEEAMSAIDKMNGTELEGWTITVDPWSLSEGDSSAKRPSKTEWSKEKSKTWKRWNNDDNDWYWNMLATMTGQTWGESRHRQLRSRRGDTKVRAWVGNLNYRADWRDLKNHMEPAGDVKWSEVMTKGGWQGAKSKGTGFVEYKTPEQVTEAVNSLNGTEMQGRQIVVDRWTHKTW